MTDLSNAWNDMDITNIVCCILVHLIMYLLSSHRLFHLFSLKSYPVMLFFSQSTSPAFVKVIHDFHAVKFNSWFAVFILLDLYSWADMLIVPLLIRTAHWTSRTKFSCFLCI